MIRDPLTAPVVIVDGPLTLYVHKASREEINHAYNCLGRFLTVACDQFDAEDPVPPLGALPEPPHDSRRSPDGEGS